MSRTDLGYIIRYTTGHAHLRRHNKIAGTLQPRSFGPEPFYDMKDPDDHDVSDDPEVRCRLCRLKGKEETPYHIVTECLAIWHSRWSNLGHYTFETCDHFDWDPTKLVGYLKEIDLENKPN